jgi:micrococcal nuclease
VVATACQSDAAATPPGSAAVVANATVERIVDGDTIVVKIDGRRDRVRLIGIDTPETKKENTPVQCFGPEATEYTTTLLPAGTPIHLERDVVARDDFDRLLAYVYVAADGTFVNLEIVRHGFARPLTIRPNVAHSDEFVEAARVAERDNIGLWARCTG